MRLIHTQSYKLHTYLNHDHGKHYAILSHRWLSKNQGKEVLYAEYNPARVLRDRSLAYVKIRESCRIAREHGFNWIWIDTCCIDQSSSSELSEAINSMWKWYSKADLCLAYLADVPYPRRSREEVFLTRDRRCSEWFSRGWTLQELIAPDNVLFFSGEWECLGTKHDLAEEIEEACHVPRDALLSPSKAFQYNVAARMSWAADRVTTKVEDMAYSLLGLFDINMPLLYGEFEKAFYRLQCEILNSRHDLSVLAWGLDDTKRLRIDPARRVPDFYERPLAGLLASSPKSFAGSADLSDEVLSLDDHLLARAAGINTRPHRLMHRKPYAFTNIGLEIELPILHNSNHRGGIVYLGLVDNGRQQRGKEYCFVGIRVMREEYDNEFVRMDNEVIYLTAEDIKNTERIDMYLRGQKTWPDEKSHMVAEAKAARRAIGWRRTNESR